MLLTDARRRARTDADGELIPLASRIDAVDESSDQRGHGVAHARPVARRRRSLPAAAAIAALHDEAATAGDTTGAD